jgi:hypothetical protein
VLGEVPEYASGQEVGTIAHEEPQVSQGLQTGME